MRQPQGPSKQEIGGVDSASREISNNNNNNKPSGDAKSRVSSPISNSPSTLPHSSSILPTNSSSSTAPMSVIGALIFSAHKAWVSIFFMVCFEEVMEFFCFYWICSSKEEEAAACQV